ncbi:hypothetical protein [Streptomyces sp. NPDC051286]
MRTDSDRPRHRGGRFVLTRLTTAWRSARLRAETVTATDMETVAA